mmetsp:Transcript_30620/g.78629  ORF Transcript_30620/g.78629 Transcript_30620/m.78629 type:complete len:173 (-) Transcript_30620:372-890(-)
MEGLGDTVMVVRGGELIEVPTATLSGKTLGLYFSAHWCPPCRGFTPHLKTVYEAVQAQRKDFEVIFVSRDRDADAFKEYFSSMPWAAVPFDGGVRDKLCTTYGVSGIPCLVIVGPDGHVIAKNARGAVAKDPTGQQFPWEGATEQPGSMNFLLIAAVIFMLLRYVFGWSFGS